MGEQRRSRSLQSKRCSWEGVTIHGGRKSSGASEIDTGPSSSDWGDDIEGHSQHAPSSRSASIVNSSVMQVSVRTLSKVLICHAFLHCNNFVCFVFIISSTSNMVA